MKLVDRPAKEERREMEGYERERERGGGGGEREREVGGGGVRATVRVYGIWVLGTVTKLKCIFFKLFFLCFRAT